MRSRFSLWAVAVVALIGGMLGSTPILGQLVSSFENDLTSTVDATWEGDGIASSTFETAGATDGSSALGIHFSGGWSIQAILRSGMPLAELASQHDFLLIDVTTTDLGVAGDGWSPAWRQIIPVFNSNQGGWQQTDFNFTVAGDDGGSLTETIILDLASSGIKANAQTFVDSGGGENTWWELFLAMQGGDQGIAQAGNYATADAGVNAADYTAWRDGLGGSTLSNETVSLGIVDGEDYDEWKASFGNNYSITTIIDNIRFTNAGAGSLGGGTVPEPGSVWLALGAVWAAAAARRNRN